MSMPNEWPGIRDTTQMAMLCSGPPREHSTPNLENRWTAGLTYRGRVQVVVLDGFPLLQDPQLLESLYQHLHLRSRDIEMRIFWDEIWYTYLQKTEGEPECRKLKENQNDTKRHTEWLCISFMLAPGLQSFMHSLFVSSIRLYSSSWGQSWWGFEIWDRVFKTPNWTAIVSRI